MKLTPQELDNFKNLSNTDISKFLVDYCKRIQDWAHDSRSWGPDDTKESAAQASRLIQEMIIDKFRPKPNNAPSVNQME